MTPHFGRVIEKDPRSIDFYPISKVAPKAITNQIIWPCAKTLNQGPHPRCCAFQFTTELLAEPIPIAIAKPGQFATRLHAECGDNTGASLLSVVKRLTERGYYSSYYWGRSVEDLVHGMAFGPALVGIDWLQRMSFPSLSGFLNPSGDFQGRHLLMARGYDKAQGWVMFQNTWGKSWGIDGHCFMTLPAVRSLLARPEAEICFPIGRRKP